MTSLDVRNGDGDSNRDRTGQELRGGEARSRCLDIIFLVSLSPLVASLDRKTPMLRGQRILSALAR